jgi:hypothetical protein
MPPAKRTAIMASARNGQGAPLAGKQVASFAAELTATLR